MCVFAPRTAYAAPDWSQYETNPFVIKLDLPPPHESAGRLIAADITGDGRLDCLVSAPGHISASDHSGKHWWSNAARDGLWLLGHNEYG